ncbi:MAG: heme-binding protein [Armatimonadota bacterium]|nr:heme-binding protein [Armatimonadota bacterium]MDR7448512.1 heme-binding protein [Armatimonadota bacterium]MDR7459088.1 heme-binding protein [Armatimonadota bacterium]MDR7479404.1 heme-binding protein [Armatimonadota bacterium]MDR7487446.1 heme-binding protein [Armatimonadota bacterium]
MTGLSLAQALAAVEAARAEAVRLGVALGIAVVDAAGHPVVVVRMDGAIFLAPELALKKAFTAAAFRRPTSAIAPRLTTSDFWMQAPAVAQGRILASGGGVPLLVDGTLVGAVGTSGGTSEQDDLCAQAAAAAVAGGDGRAAAGGDGR